MRNSSPTKTVEPDHRWGVAAILFISLILRWILIFRGGQYYFSDEQRYETSRAVADLIASGNFNQALAQLFIAPEHLGFKIIGIIPALFEQFTRESLIIPAHFFSLFSTLNLYLIYQISRRAQATERESLTALIFAASSMSLLYYSRHLMPYDSALTFALLVLYVALAEKPTIKTSLACGGLSFLCFITYNGYWSLAGLGMLVHIFRNNASIIELLRKGLLAATGFIAPIILLFIAALWSGTNLLTEYRVFATTVSQGSYAEGWSLPFEYFWHTEYLVFIALILLSLYAIFESKGRNKTINLWAGATIFIYLCLLIPSVFLHSFVVYGRLVRQMMPFFILLSASGLARIELNFSEGQKLARVLLAVIIIQAAWNYKTSYNVSYPREFAWKAQTLQPEFEFSEKRLAFGAPTLCQNNGFVIENVKHFITPPEPNLPVQGDILLSEPHTDNFLPYQYEGYTYDERQKFRELQLQMRFYKVDDGFMSESNPAWTTIKNCVVKEN